MLDDLEKLLTRIYDKITDLLYQSRAFTYGLIAFLVLVLVAFPRIFAWILATTVVFIFIKGLILILKMISDR